MTWLRGVVRHMQDPMSRVYMAATMLMGFGAGILVSVGALFFIMPMHQWRGVTLLCVGVLVFLHSLNRYDRTRTGK